MMSEVILKSEISTRKGNGTHLDRRSFLIDNNGLISD
jgi:hypothetical protein